MISLFTLQYMALQNHSRYFSAGCSEEYATSVSLSRSQRFVSSQDLLERHAEILACGSSTKRAIQSSCVDRQEINRQAEKKGTNSVRERKKKTHQRGRISVLGKVTKLLQG